MKKVIGALLAVAVIAAASAPAASAKSTAQKVASLQKSVASLVKANTVLTVRVKKDEARIAVEESKSRTQATTNDLLVKSSLLLLGLSNCQTNTLQSDFTFADGVHTESWFAGDTFGPNPAGGFSFCVSQAIAAVGPASNARAARASSGLLPLIQAAVHVRSTAAVGR